MEKLAVFVILLVQVQLFACSCVNKTVDITVVNGIDLTGDVFGHPDPYVVVIIDGESKRTEVIPSSSNPTWWQRFKFNSTTSGLLTAEVWDEDSFLNGSDDLLGTCTEQLSHSSKLKVVMCFTKNLGLVNLMYRCY